MFHQGTSPVREAPIRLSYPLLMDEIAIRYPKEECAFKIIATVVSRPTADRGILDGSSKTFSSDLLGLDGHGLILEYPRHASTSMSEEHGHVDFLACARKPAIGDRVTVIVNHCCPVANLLNQIVGVRDDTVDSSWPVAARGMLQ